MCCDVPLRLCVKCFLTSHFFHVLVHDSISDDVAVFAEPLAAACKILEQKLVQKDQLVCVIGDGKLGLLICEVLSCSLDLKRLVLIGKYPHKMGLVSKVVEKFDHSDMTKTLFNDYFDIVIEATGYLCTNVKYPCILHAFPVRNV